MKKSTISISSITPADAQRIAEELTFQMRRRYGNLRMELDDNDDPDDDDNDPDNDDKDDDGDKGGDDKGFPPNTPVKEMTADQQAAYWKDKARKHEGRNRELGNLTPQELADLRDKAKKHDDLEQELMSDHDKALAAAREEGRAEARKSYVPQLVKAEFRAAVNGSLSDEELDGLLEDLNLDRFVNDKGAVDVEKVTGHVSRFVKVDEDGDDKKTPPRRKGPSSTGSGGRGSSSAGVSSIQAGREAYKSRTAS